MQLLRMPSCCGIGELNGIHVGPSQVIQGIKLLTINTSALRFNMIVFTDGNSYISGVNLSKYIQDHKLGTVTESEWIHNHNYYSGRMVKLWTWLPDWEAINNHK